MAGLEDIVPQTEKATIRGVEIEITGINLASIGLIWGRFPEFATMVSRREFDLPSIMALGPDLVAALLAAGTGAVNNEKAEAVARSLSLDEQTDLMSRILKISLPRGVGPFVETVVAAAQALGMRPSPELNAGVVKASGKSHTQSKPSQGQATAA